MSDFIVRFHGVELSKEHAERVQASIQKAVLAEVPASSLSAYTPDPDGPDNYGSVVFLPNWYWRGIIYLPGRSLRGDVDLLKTSLQVVPGPSREEI